MNLLAPGDSISSVKGIGPSISEKLTRLGIVTVADLIKHFPRTYLDFSKRVKIKDLKDKVPCSFMAVIESPKTFYTGSHRLITQATAKDDTGKVTLTWFNNPYIKRLIQEGPEYSIAGKPSTFGAKLTLISPSLEEGNSFSLNTQGLVPVYPQTEGITSKWLRKKIFEILNTSDFRDPLEEDLLKKHDFLSLSEAFYKIHFPKENHERYEADKRLAFNEHLRINLNNKLEKNEIDKSVAIKIDKKINSDIAKLLPFELTSSQNKTVTQIEKDLRKTELTHRLIQGETGSGKTAPLLFASAQVISNGFSAAIMAPTEILANQHFETFKKYSLYPKQVCLVTSSNKAKITNKPTLFIGTHALLNQLPKEIKPALAFIAIDEQHKFGVSQRHLLLDRKPVPHLFNLSATPIPRTLALGVLGDIEISNLKHKPQNRLPVKTHVVSPTKFKDSPKWLIKELEQGNQIYIVCPNISEHSPEIASVEKQSDFYRHLLPKKFPVFTIHGKITREKQQDIISEFKKTPSSLLVSTSLIEVGIDIPTANIMIIHSAERFGLAQLHQLRGRVGRGKEQGYCFLVTSLDDETEIERLKLLKKYHDGLTLAKKDLRLRGAGEIYGEKQHGAFQTRLKYFWSKKLFLLSKSEAAKLISSDRKKAALIARNLLTW